MNGTVFVRILPGIIIDTCNIGFFNHAFDFFDNSRADKEFLANQRVALVIAVIGVA